MSRSFAAAIIFLTLTAAVSHYLQADTAFSSKKNLSKSPGISISPQMAVSGSNVYAGWSEETSPLVFDIFFRRSTNEGSTFGPIMNLSNNAGNSEEAQIAASGTNVYLVWVDDTPGDPSIFFRRSTNNGASFDNVINLSKNGSAEEPQIAVSGNNVYVVWAQANGDVFFSKSTNGGAIFGSKVNLSNNAGGSIAPQIDATGSNVYVAWEDSTPGNEDILFRSSTDNGTTFGAQKNISKAAGSGFSGFQTLAASGNNVYIAWLDDSPGNDEILFRRSINNGAVFEPVINLSNNPEHSEEPQVAVSGSYVYVTWENDNPSFVPEVLFRRSTDSGIGFKATKNLSNNAGISESPQIDAAGTNVYILWPDDTSGGAALLFRMSTNNGGSFGSSQTLNNTGSSEPQVAAGSGDKVFTIWINSSTGNLEIFFRSGP
jgi:hypothetical protein